MGASHPDTAAWGPKNEKKHAIVARHVKKICDVKRVDQKKGRQTYRNCSEQPPRSERLVNLIEKRDFLKKKRIF